MLRQLAFAAYVPTLLRILPLEVSHESRGPDFQMFCSSQFSKGFDLMGARPAVNHRCFMFFMAADFSTASIIGICGLFRARLRGQVFTSLSGWQ